MIRYANERFLDIELTSTSNTGLKIPVSAITEEEFYTIQKLILQPVETAIHMVLYVKNIQQMVIKQHVLLPLIFINQMIMCAMSAKKILQPEVILLSLIQQNDMLSVPLKNLKAYIALIPVIQHLNLLI